MIIDCISDLHGYYPKLDGGDLLIIAGDLTAHDTVEEHDAFIDWLSVQKYKKKIFIAGNHDNFYVNSFTPWWAKHFEPPCKYLCDSETKFDGLKIWGSPWTKTFQNMNPNCKAFTLDSDDQLAEKWALIPNDIDILITHSPPHGIFDGIDNIGFCGDLNLRNQVMDRIKPKLHIFGHIHEWGGHLIDTNITTFVNSSYVNELYQPVNNPIRVIL